MRPLLSLLCTPALCLALAAQAPTREAERPSVTPSARTDDSSVRFGFGLHVATGLGDMSHDLNGHPGFGFRLQAYVPVSSRFEVRPAFEWTGYRVNAYNLAARLLATALDADYQETRVVFRTYRVGLDGLFYFREGKEGPFLSAGLGAQRSQVYLEDRTVTSDGESADTLDTRAQKTGLWLGAGLGYQWKASNLELRLSNAPYAYTSDRNLGAQPTEAPFGGRSGWALHFIWGARF